MVLLIYIRRQILEKKKATENRIRAASLVKDHLTNFPHFRHYRGGGMFAAHASFFSNNFYDFFFNTIFMMLLINDLGS